MIRIRIQALLLALAVSLTLGVAHAGEELLTLENGDTIKVLFFQPAAGTDSPPLALLVSGGASNEFMARAQFWMGKEMVDRGWAVAVPISPEGRKYFVENADLYPQIIAGLRDLHSLKDERTLLVGISSGGSAALAIAAQHPENYRGVVATPGRIWDESKFQSLGGLPIYLRIGERDDFRWNRRLESETALLQEAGAQVNAALVPDARHIFSIDWEDLEGWLNKLQPQGL